MNRKTAAFIIFSLSLCITASAQKILIKGVDVYTLAAEGTIKSGQIFIEDGVIRAMGKNVRASKDVKVITVDGGSVTPGFCNSKTHLGIEEISAAKGTVDISTENSEISASLTVADGFNSASVYIPYNLSRGLTHALIVPESAKNLIAGQAAFVDLSGTHNNKSIANDYAALVVSLGERGSELASGSRAAALRQLTVALNDAKDYLANKAEYEKGQLRKLSLSKQDLDALEPVIERKKPLLVNVHRASDIQRVLAFSKEHNVRVIVMGGEEAWLLSEELASSKTPVVLYPLSNLPRKFETLGSRLDNAALLDKAGVQIAFMTTNNQQNANLVRQAAGNAVANGLGKEAAIAAISKNPAQLFGKREGDYGVLEVGKKADLVIWDGDPLDVLTSPKIVFVNGQRASMKSRSTRLAARYLKKHKALLKD